MPSNLTRLLRDGAEALAEKAISAELIDDDHSIIRVLGVTVFDSRWRERRLRRRAKLRALRRAANK